jgi:hypothetical protein
MQASQFRVEKTRAMAELVFATGSAVQGYFFLWPSNQVHARPDRIGDLLNEKPGFFLFQMHDGHTALYNRQHLLLVRLPLGVREPQIEAGYEVATRRRIRMLLSTGDTIIGTVSVYLPGGHDRLSDYARSDQTFRYVETETHTVIVNSGHVVELREIEADDVGVR